MQSEGDNYVAWCRYVDDGNRIVLCDSDSKGAFKVYRDAPPTREVDAIQVVEGMRDEARIFVQKAKDSGGYRLQECEARVAALNDALTALRPAPRPRVTVAELRGSNPDFTDNETTDEYMRRVRGRAAQPQAGEVFQYEAEIRNRLSLAARVISDALHAVANVPQHFRSDVASQVRDGYQRLREQLAETSDQLSKGLDSPAPARETALTPTAEQMEAAIKGWRESRHHDSLTAEDDEDLMFVLLALQGSVPTREACVLGEPLMHGPHPYPWCATHNQLMMTCEHHGPPTLTREAVLREARAPIARIASQHLRCEMETDEDGDIGGDFEYAYDELVKEGRTALAAIDRLTSTDKGEDVAHVESNSPSGKLWRKWFAAVGEHGSISVVHATATLVTEERKLLTAPPPLPRTRPSWWEKDGGWSIDERVPCGHYCRDAESEPDRPAREPWPSQQQLDEER